MNKKNVCMWNDCGGEGTHKFHVDGQVIGHYCNEHVKHAKNFLNDKINKMPTAETYLPHINVPVCRSTIYVPSNHV